MLSLHELQTYFFHSIARVPGGSSHFDPLLIRSVEGKGLLGPEERIDIYAQMYYARLLTVLHEDFPRVAAILGCARFDAIVRPYLACYPSTHPSLRHLGHHFPVFLDTRTEAESLPFLGDLARLEWTRLEVFDAPDAEPLSINHLQNIAPDEWPDLRFHVIPAFQVFQSNWPMHEIWATAEEETPNRECLRQEKTTLRVWRQDFTVYHTRIDAIEQVALDHVLAGEPFATVCAALESLLPAEEAVSTVGSLLLRWIEDGLLTDLPQQ